MKLKPKDNTSQALHTIFYTSRIKTSEPRGGGGGGGGGKIRQPSWSSEVLKAQVKLV